MDTSVCTNCVSKIHRKLVNYNYWQSHSSGWWRWWSPMTHRWRTSTKVMIINRVIKWGGGRGRGKRKTNIGRGWDPKGWKWLGGDGGCVAARRRWGRKRWRNEGKLKWRGWGRKKTQSHILPTNVTDKYLLMDIFWWICGRWYLLMNFCICP